MNTKLIQQTIILSSVSLAGYLIINCPCETLLSCNNKTNKFNILLGIALLTLNVNKLKM